MENSKNVLSEDECPFCGESINVVDYFWEDGVLVLEMECDDENCEKNHKAYYKAEYLVSKIESDEDDSDDEEDEDQVETDDEDE